MAWCEFCKDASSFFSTRYECELTKEYVPYGYINYCKSDYKVSKCPWYIKYGNKSSSTCFITTASCNILGKEDNDNVLNSLRNFRDEVLQKDKKYENVLKLYDSIGLLLSCYMNHDNNKDYVAKEVYEKLIKLCNLIKDKKYDDAVNNYIIMTLKLVSKYNLQKKYRQIRDDNFGFSEGEFDQSNAGHGKRLLK